MRGTPGHHHIQAQETNLFTEITDITDGERELCEALNQKGKLRTNHVKGVYQLKLALDRGGQGSSLNVVTAQTLKRHGLAASVPLPLAKRDKGREGREVRYSPNYVAITRLGLIWIQLREDTNQIKL